MSASPTAQELSLREFLEMVEYNARAHADRAPYCVAIDTWVETLSMPHGCDAGDYNILVLTNSINIYIRPKPGDTELSHSDLCSALRAGLSGALLTIYPSLRERVIKDKQDCTEFEWQADNDFHVRLKIYGKPKAEQGNA